MSGCWKVRRVQRAVTVLLGTSEMGRQDHDQKLRGQGEAYRQVRTCVSLLNGAARRGTGGPKRPAALGENLWKPPIEQGQGEMTEALGDVSRVSGRLPGDANAVWKTVAGSGLLDPSLEGMRGMEQLAGSLRGSMSGDRLGGEEKGIALPSPWFLICSAGPPFWRWDSFYGQEPGGGIDARAAMLGSSSVGGLSSGLAGDGLRVRGGGGWQDRICVGGFSRQGQNRAGRRRWAIKGNRSGQRGEREGE